jgi:hypothetical protein
MKGIEMAVNIRHDLNEILVTLGMPLFAYTFE